MKKNWYRLLILAISCGVLAGFSSGCAWSIGDCKDRPAVHPPTKGQELMDLKKAKDQGAISDQEYDNQRQQILNK